MPKTKIALDVRIVAYFLYGIAFLQLACVVLLVTGVGRLEDGYTRRVFLGTILLSTEMAFVVHLLCMSSVDMLCAWGIIRRLRAGWWFALIYSTYHLVDTASLFPKHRIAALLGIAIVVAIIIWLLLRRRLYVIGLKLDRSPG